MVSDLIYDIGVYNGDDTAYYLHKGFRVVGIEANPVLAGEAQSRFSQEVAAGRLTILNVGIAESEGTLPFWINEDNGGWSSFDRDLGCRNGTRSSEVKVRTMRLSTVLERYGVPYYLKVDIEGSDSLCVSELERGDLPKYISVELPYDYTIIPLLQSVGYRIFKVINQETFTDSTPLFQDEIGLRALRKLTVHSGFVRRAVHRLPSGIRPKRFDFDDFLLGFEYEFKGACSGPFGEDTYDRWKSFEEVMVRVAEIRRAHEKRGRSLSQYGYDIHATR